MSFQWTFLHMSLIFISAEFNIKLFKSLKTYQRKPMSKASELKKSSFCRKGRVGIIQLPSLYHPATDYLVLTFSITFWVT